MSKPIDETEPVLALCDAFDPSGETSKNIRVELDELRSLEEEAAPYRAALKKAFDEKTQHELTTFFERFRHPTDRTLGDVLRRATVVLDLARGDVSWGPAGRYALSNLVEVNQMGDLSPYNELQADGVAFWMLMAAAWSDKAVRPGDDRSGT